ncbi:MAG: hypothetical protein IJ982_10345, partial [Fibrobacter sp.]|nr:hypothetical protein [Fibrobacter sp.]
KRFTWNASILVTWRLQIVHNVNRLTNRVKNARNGAKKRVLSKLALGNSRFCPKKVGLLERKFLIFCVLNITPRKGTP